MNCIHGLPDCLVCADDVQFESADAAKDYLSKMLAKDSGVIVPQIVHDIGGFRIIRHLRDGDCLRVTLEARLPNALGESQWVLVQTLYPNDGGTYLERAFLSLVWVRGSTLLAREQRPNPDAP